MFFKISSALTVLAVAACAAAQALTVNTPLSVVVCQPIQLTWSGGTGPYFLSILPGNQPGAQALIDFGRQEGTSLSWTANLGVGTSFFLQVRDNTGTIGQSGTISVQTGSDTSCVGQSTSGANTSTGTGSTSAASTPAATGTVTTTSGTGTSRPVSSGASSTKAAASTTPSSGAIKFAASGALSLAGVAAVAALL